MWRLYCLALLVRGSLARSAYEGPALRTREGPGSAGESSGEAGQPSGTSVELSESRPSKAELVQEYKDAAEKAVEALQPLEVLKQTSKQLSAKAMLAEGVRKATEQGLPQRHHELEANFTRFEKDTAEAAKLATAADELSSCAADLQKARDALAHTWEVDEALADLAGERLRAVRNGTAEAVRTARRNADDTVIQADRMVRGVREAADRLDKAFRALDEAGYAYKEPLTNQADALNNYAEATSRSAQDSAKQAAHDAVSGAHELEESAATDASSAADVRQSELKTMQKLVEHAAARHKALELEAAAHASKEEGEKPGSEQSKKELEEQSKKEQSKKEDEAAITKAREAHASAEKSEARLERKVEEERKIEAQVHQEKREVERSHWETFMLLLSLLVLCAATGLLAFAVGRLRWHKQTLTGLIVRLSSERETCISKINELSAPLMKAHETLAESSVQPEGALLPKPAAGP
mmetsp:Transcript_73456/g.192635  ORF Transcript_73456/g.192635 Transcript_73456/m.192635 type:complete len:469 (+) Transcript_73456:102-1508(+)